MNDEHHLYVNRRADKTGRKTAMGRRLIATVAIMATGFVGALSIAAPASARTAEDCKTVTAGLANHPDSGLHGTWATDTIARTVKVCQLDTQQWTAKQLDEVNALSEKYDSPFSLYSVDVSDTGTFVTKGGAHLSPEDGDALVAGIHGTLEGYYKTFVTALKDWKSWNGPSVQGQTYNPGDSTGEWVKMLFGEHAKWSDPYAWKWVYTTCNQVWKNAAGGNSGDITGEVACPSASPSPSASASPSPSVSVTTAPASTTSAPVAAPADLPVTGASATLPIVTGAALLTGAVAYWGFVLYRRRKAEVRS